MTIEEQLAKAERERDSFKRQLATLQDAILLALVQRIEPRMSRHPVTVVQHAGSIIARIGEAMVCQFEDGDDLVEAAKELVRERDKARAELAGLPAWQKGCEHALGDLAAAEEVIARLYTERDEARWHAEGLRSALTLVETERDEARAEVERLRNAVHSRACRNQSAYNLECVCGADEHQRDLRKLAFSRGAEAMREACAVIAMDLEIKTPFMRAERIRFLPIPEKMP